MEANNAQLAEGGEDEEVDPLDAFMATEIAPAVRRDLSAAAAPPAAAKVKVEDSEDVKPPAPVQQVIHSASCLECSL